MKRFNLVLAMSILSSTLSFGQKNYEMVVEKTDGTSSVFNTEDVARTYFRERGVDNPSYTSCPDSNHPHMIDLGLPSGTKWACCNVGATKPEEYGGYYAWGETEEKSYYDWSTYKWCKGSYNTMTKYYKVSYVTVDKDLLDPEDDVAHVKWGSSWVMPSYDQIKELLDNCTDIWTTENGVKGCRFTGSNGGTIFLPAAGYREGGELHDVGIGGGYHYGCYWSSKLGGESSEACGFYVSSGGAGRSAHANRDLGYTVRPVR